MEVSFAECEAYVKTLPIGYYAKRRISISMDKEAETSYYSPVEDRIGISYAQISTALKGAVDESDRDMLIRSSFYHEVSHAIATPSSMRVDVPVNIFEDERIETIFKGYYVDVDFKKNVYAINGGVHEAKDATQAFYNAVRFRIGPESILKKVDSIINDYSYLSRSSDFWTAYEYVNRIHDLFKEVSKEFSKNPDSFKGSDKGDSKNPQKDLKEGEQGQKQESSEGDSPESEGEESEADSEQAAESSCEMDGKGRPMHGKYAKTISDVLKDAFENLEKSLTDEQQKDIAKFKSIAETCITNFNKKNNSGNGTFGYNGIFNPRAVAREDYRYFDRKTSVNGNNRFGTCHLNLFIDKSGSFYDSQFIINALLKTLTEIERRNKNFSVDIVFCGMGEFPIKEVKDREISCEGGNALDEELKPLFTKLQKSGTYNYNIALFDGDAFSDFKGKIGEAQKIFSTFDTINTTLITDPDNERYIDYHSARVVITQKYTDNLLKELAKVMGIAFH